MSSLTDELTKTSSSRGPETQQTDTPLHLLVKMDFWSKNYNVDDATKYKDVIAELLGDSDSSKMLAGRFSRAATCRRSQRSSSGPYFATYDGGHVNHWNGQYAGVSDIQGMDFYVAGCAPHITAVLAHEIRGL